jgi:hypothetical protein
MNMLPRYVIQTFGFGLQNIGSEVEERDRRRKINKHSSKNRDKYEKSISQ